MAITLRHTTLCVALMLAYQQSLADSNISESIQGSSQFTADNTPLLLSHNNSESQIKEDRCRPEL